MQMKYAVSDAKYKGTMHSHLICIFVCVQMHSTRNICNGYGQYTSHVFHKNGGELHQVDLFQGTIPPAKIFERSAAKSFN